MEYGEVINAFELMQKAVGAGIVILIFGVLFGIASIFSVYTFAVWLALMFIASAYPVYLMWRAFSLLHRNFDSVLYRYAAYVLLIVIVAMPVIGVVLAAYLISVAWGLQRPPVPGSDLGVRLVLWLVGVLFGAFWYRVWKQVEIDTNVDTFGIVALLTILSAVLSPVSLISDLLDLAFLIVLYFAAGKAKDVFEDALLSQYRKEGNQHDLHK
ncbi:hypothetical protein ODS41_03470 [Pyrobaculum sp. 3827-6]|uniref:hypothetical protein n=1 Tax=Pyrobaculum TaxID=2276 RepID=UPI000AD5822E|nr:MULTISPECIES: hypothetical protein [Pyrobaculum]MCU7786989.1 hypothetical protein [Pyrobaculum sp. 3827-6]